MKNKNPFKLLGIVPSMETKEKTANNREGTPHPNRTTQNLHPSMFPSFNEAKAIVEQINKEIDITLVAKLSANAIQRTAFNIAEIKVNVRKSM
jgi:hypothetical protein|tara:strand:+ start:2649 stop:2927 length:279 start_codon:yes stop_codon:yes gene_type:complete